MIDPGPMTWARTSFFILVLSALRGGLSAPAYAMTAPDSDVDSDYELVPIDSDKIRPTDHFGASTTEVSTASCKSTQSPTSTMIRRYFEKKRNGVKKIASAKVHGLTLTSVTASELQALKDLTTTDPWFGPDEQIDLKKRAPKCSDVTCTLETVFGSEEGLRLYYLYDRHGFNGSHFVYTNADVWKAAELDTLISAVQDLPDSMNVFKNQRLMRFKRGYTLAMYGDGSSVVANATITVFDPWDKQNAWMKHYTIFHEIAHNLGEVLETTSTWKTLSKDPKLAVSEYAKTNVFEDMAESISTYRYAPEYLEAISPAKYELIRKEIYAGREFKNEAACSGLSDRDRAARVRLAMDIVSKSGELERSVQKSVGDPSTTRFDPALTSCVAEIRKDPGSLSACLKKQVRAPWLGSVADKMQSTPLELAYQQLPQTMSGAQDAAMAANAIATEIRGGISGQVQKMKAYEDWIALAVQARATTAQEIHEEVQSMPLTVLDLKYGLEESDLKSCNHRSGPLAHCNDPMRAFLQDGGSAKSREALHACYVDKMKDDCFLTDSWLSLRMSNFWPRLDVFKKTYFALVERTAVEFIREGMLARVKQKVDAIDGFESTKQKIAEWDSNLKTNWADQVLRFTEEMDDVAVPFVALKPALKTHSEIEAACDQYVKKISLDSIEDHFYLPGFLLAYDMKGSADEAKIEPFRTRVKAACMNAKPRLRRGKVVLPLRRFLKALNADIETLF